MTNAAHADRARRRFSRLLPAALVLGALGCEELPNVPPEASFLFSPVSPIYAGQTRVVFNASPSRDSDGSIKTYRWDWGDGSAEQALGEPLTSHVFPDNGIRCVDVTYAVLLTVVDDKGEAGATSQAVKVTPPSSPSCPRP